MAPSADRRFNMRFSQNHDSDGMHRGSANGRTTHRHNPVNGTRQKTDAATMTAPYTNWTNGTNGDSRDVQRVRDLQILQETVRSLQIRASALLARVPELRSAHDIKMSLFEMADDIETKISVLEAYGTNKIPASIFADLDVWFKGNTQELQETLKFLDDFERCLQATSSSSSSPQSTALAVAPAPTQEPANNNTLLTILEKLSSLQHHVEQTEHARSQSEARLTAMIAKLNQRLDGLGQVMHAEHPRCFVSRFKRDRACTATDEDLVLIDNCGAQAAAQTADCIRDAQQFFALYGRSQGKEVARAFGEAFVCLYGLTPVETRGSIREGPVADVINNYANERISADQLEVPLHTAFNEFIEEVRKWTYLPGVGFITVPEFKIDEDLERQYWKLRNQLKGGDSR